jgi:hypothetical protein
MGGKLKAFSLEFGARQGFLLLPLLFNTAGSPSQNIQRTKRNKGHPNWKREVKYTVIADDMIF